MTAENPAPVALVTGSSRGIGRATAVELARHGFDIVVHFRADSKAAESAVAEVTSLGRRALAVQADLGDAKARERLVAETFDAYGRIDVLVNNAAMAPRARVDILDLAPADFEEVLAVNLEAPFFLTQLVARRMIEIRERDPERRLAIVNVSSVSEYASTPNRAAYCIAKAGVGMLTRLFADRLAPHEILVNAVRPGIILTDMTAAVEATYDRRIREEGLTPLRRWGRPEDVARAIRALVSGDFDFSTG
ncbi:MAG TPA: 3-ketoacyl-ACP reductase, partial [Planctomycetota bacterium]|nr:3-ketoacyl-ACP reductase [Planctomycetota bacterium]